MRITRFRWLGVLFGLLFLALSGNVAQAQSTATLQGIVLDEKGGTIAGSRVTVQNILTGEERTTETDATGTFLIAALAVGTYRIEVQRDGFQNAEIKAVKLDVASTVTENFSLKVGSGNEKVVVTSEAPVVESTTMTVGQVIDDKTVQEIPLNGRHFVDLGLLIPGSVTPPQNGFLTFPLRGQGSFSFVTAGNREDTVNFMVNGINLNDQNDGQITFQPSINTVQEFKVDNSTLSAEEGRNSGAIVNIATRSGSNQFHGEVFEYLRNDALDARNFFNFAKLSDGSFNPKGPFKRNQFGAAVGGPIRKDKTFFFFSYEGLRQRQGLNLNTTVLSDAERAQALAGGNATVVKLLPLIPKADLGLNGFVGAATAPVNLNQWTLDVGHNIGTSDRIHGYTAVQQDQRQEPILQGNTVPGFGDTRKSRRQIFTVNETHIFSSTLVNEARLGFNRIHITFLANSTLNPTAFGINVGHSGPFGLPEMNFDSIGLDFGGPAGFPSGRGDTTAAFSDTVNYLRGKHSFKFGGEVRRFYNNNFGGDTGLLVFSDVPSFINGTARLFQITQGSQDSKILQPSYGAFVQDSWKMRPNFALDLGLRYDANLAPSDSQNRFTEFDPTTSSLVRVGTAGLRQVYKSATKLFEPRVGFAWDPFHSGKTSVRGGFSLQADQPITGNVTPLTLNPPFANPIIASSGTITFSNPTGSGVNGAIVSPATINPHFRNAYVQSWNLNVQRELTATMGMSVGYYGSKGTHLPIAINLNQPIGLDAQNNPIQRFNTVSANSPILPNAPLGPVIAEEDSTSNSSYNALWVTANKRFSHGFQFNSSYTYSHSIDYNSLTSQPIVVQDSTNVRGDRGSSDFDARHRFVISTIYELPFKGNRLKEGWQLSTVIQWQSGNPMDIITGLTALTGVANMRPDLIGSLKSLGGFPTTSSNSVFSNSVCDPSTAGSCTSTSVFALPLSSSGVPHFGNFGRNVLTGPRFSNTDFSVLKNIRITERLRAQFRAELFDAFNHPNFGQPSITATPGSTRFGVIHNTRFPTGDSGSSRQVQFALKLSF